MAGGSLEAQSIVSALRNAKRMGSQQRGAPVGRRQILPGCCAPQMHRSQFDPMALSTLTAFQRLLSPVSLMILFANGLRD